MSKYLFNSNNILTIGNQFRATPTAKYKNPWKELLTQCVKSILKNKSKFAVFEVLWNKYL